MRTVARLALAALLAAALAPAPAPAQDVPPAPAPAAAPDEIPPIGPRAPPPADPTVKVAKDIEAGLRLFFDSEPTFAPDPAGALRLKGDRGTAASKIQAGVIAWNAALGGKASCLRRMDWWKAKLFDTITQQNRQGGKVEKLEIPFEQGKFPIVLSVPSKYRGKSTDLWPVLLTVLDKGGDPKRILQDLYGDLLNTHIIVAAQENTVPRALVLLRAPLPWIFHNFRADRERVVLDGVGKGARFVDELAAECAVYFNGAVFRSSKTLSPLARNLALFPCAAVVPASPEAAVVATVTGLRANCPGLREFAPEQARELQQWIAALPPRRISDQGYEYTWTDRSEGNRQKWGYWVFVVRTVDSGKDQPVVVTVRRDPARNLLDLECTNLDQGVALLNDEVFDLDQPVTIRVNGIVAHREEKPVRNVLNSFDWKDGVLGNPLMSKSYFITCMIPFTVPENARLTPAEREAVRKREEEKEKQPDPPTPKDGGETVKELPAGGPETGQAPPGSPPGTPPAVRVDWYATLGEARDAAGKDGRPVFAFFEAPAGAAPDQDALNSVLERPEAKERLSKFACVRIATVAETPAVVPVVEEVLRVEAAESPLLAAIRKDGTVVAKSTFLKAGLKTEDAVATLAKWLEEMLKSAGVTLPEAKPEDPPPANPPTFKTVEEANASGRPVLVFCTAVGEGVVPSAADVAAVLETPAVIRPFSAFAVVPGGVKAGEPFVLTRPVPVTVRCKDAPVLLAVHKDGRLAARLDGTAVAPDKADASLQEWLARALGAAGAKAAEGEAAKVETKWNMTFGEARNAADRPDLVLVTGAGMPPSPAGEALAKALAAESTRAALAAFDCVTLPAKAEEVVATLKGPPEAKVGAKDAPVLYALRADESVLGTIAVAALKPAESPDGLMQWLGDMLAKAAEKPPEKEPEKQPDKPTETPPAPPADPPK